MNFSLAQKQRIVELAKEFNLKLVLLFGSMASKQTHKESDVDFAVLPEKNLSFEEEILLNTKLSALFQDKKIIDLVNLRTAPPLLGKQIITNCEILYEKEKGIFDRLAIYIYRKYDEAKPLFQLTHEKLKNFVSKI